MGLPMYQKKATIMDALCQGIESYWSVNSTSESKEYSKKSIDIILKNLDKYLNDNTKTITSKMLHASNLAGKAINITQTTAAHAMSYKLTSLYGIAHGHAVAITLPYIWEYMNDNLDKCIDPRGKKYLGDVLNELKDMVGGAKKFKKLYDSLELDKPTISTDDLTILVESVNPVRLKNNPVSLDKEAIEKIYVESLEN